MRSSSNFMTISLVFFICSVSSLNFLDFKHYSLAVKEQNTLFDDISVARGYSTDLVLMSANNCYSGESFRSGQIGSLDFSQSYKYSEVITTIGVTVELTFNFLFFKFSVFAEYTREITETSTRTSFNFIAKSSSKNFFNYGVGVDTLTEYGRDVYNNNHSQFGILCGDKIFKWYETGSMLMLSVVIEFESRQDKHTFGVGVKFNSNFNEFESSAKATLKSFRTNGKLKVIAHQIGGDPSALKRIIDMNDTRISCTFNDIERCLNFGNDIIKYINTDYPNQLKNNPAAEVPLGTFEVNPISNIGLSSPKSLVSIKVKTARKELESIVTKSNYYSASMRNAFALYPNFSGSGIDQIKSLMETFNQDFEFLKSEEGAAICWTQPQNCVSKFGDIKSQINFESYKSKIDSLMPKLLYSIEFVLNDNNSAICSNNGRRDYYAIRILPLVTGSYAIKINNVLVNGSFDGLSIVINANPQFPNLPGTIKINFTLSESYFFESVTYCNVKGNNKEIRMSGRKFRSEYYVLTFDRKDE